MSEIVGSLDTVKQNLKAILGRIPLRKLHPSKSYV